MAAVALDQYLTSVWRSHRDNKNEIKLPCGSPNFDLFTIYLENHNIGLHRYVNEAATIVYVVKGTVTLKSGEKSLEMKAGNFLLLTQSWQYEIQKQSDDAVLVKLKFSPGFEYRKFFKDLSCASKQEISIIDQILTILNKEHVLWLKTNQITHSSQVMQRIVDDYLANELFMRVLIGAELTVALVLAIGTDSVVSLSSLDRTKFEGSALDRYIDNHFTNITLTDTAKYFGFNPNYFSNMVKQKTGKSFVDHVDERRMQEARTLLAQPDISLKEIISRVGYSSKSFFYKKFNQYYHMTPAAMREELFRQANINLK